ncbi:GGDEF domain-containing protein [Solimonas sp. K1W22B-7]|uniref:GGDEF domain-containing protein n=1 Tax=Solimonas sp. K1W22B-7 TaxID=2303331 RepID=UPI000E337BF8|nr:GGDEF domain-containing protein [Solimonas sp. K1W22B-7]AXQ27768.1 GGDEF domain-containing protein [Solimonas sp. K1W22B-7]
MSDHSAEEGLAPRKAIAALRDLPEYDLTPQEAHEVADIVAAKTRQFRFPKRLEDDFQTFNRASSRNARIILAVITLLSFASAAFWAPALIGSAPSNSGFVLMLELAVITPLFGLVLWLLLRRPDADSTEWVMMGAYVIEMLVVETMRHHSDRSGFPIDPSIGVLVPIAVILMARLRFSRTMLLLAAYIGVSLSQAWLWGEAPNPHAASSWIIKWLLPALVVLASVSNKLALRRQWAAALLLRVMAHRDPLTGLPNRRALEKHYEAMSRALSRGSRSGRMVLAVIDLDHFKKVNDLHGHEYGDGVLIEIAVALSGFARRPLDMVARMGGEEFALLLHDCDEESGRQRLSALLETISGLQIENKGATLGIITVSIGAAAAPPDTRLSDAYRAADEALYRVKESGRNNYELVSL